MSDDSALYILNRDLALKTALQQNRAKLGGLYDVMQICYHDGAPFDDAPLNLVNVPIENFVEFFSSTGMRLPCLFHGENLEEQTKAKMLVKLLEMVTEIRGIKQGSNKKILNKIRPDFRNDKPWRVYLPATIHNDAGQHCLKNLAKALQEKGCDARVFIEEDDMHDNLMDHSRLLERAVEFKPHIWVSISRNDLSWLNPDMFHVIWWQDTDPSLGTAPVSWRERDILFSQHQNVDELLMKAGAEHVTRLGKEISYDIFAEEILKIIEEPVGVSAI